MEIKKLPIVVLISGSGSNLQAIIDKIASEELKNVEIKAVISNKSDAFGLERAKKAGISTEVFSFKEFQNRAMPTGKQAENKAEYDIIGQNEADENKAKDIMRQRYCAELALLVKKYNPELVVLAGWMLVLKDEFLKEFPTRVMNLHPALIPAFPGTHGIQQAFDFGAKVTGVTVHFVPDEGVDSGPVIIQEPIRIEENDTLESLEVKIHAVEHQVLPKAIQLFADDRLKLEGRKVKIV